MVVFCCVVVGAGAAFYLSGSTSFGIAQENDGAGSAGKTYYVDARAGKDGNSGTSEAQAWQGLGFVSSRNLKPGDRILFKRGEVWKGSLEIYRSGAPGKQISFDAYGTGAKPVLSGVGEVEGWNTESNWIQEGNCWHMAFKPGAAHMYRLFIDNREKQRAKSKGALGDVTCWYWENNRLYVYTKVNPAAAFSTMEYAGGVAYSVYSCNANYITLTNLDVRGGCDAIHLSNCDHWIIESCSIGWYAGEMGIKAYPSKKGASDYVEVRNCVIDSGKRHINSWYNEDPCEGIILQHANYWKIHHNVIKDWCHAGVGLSGAEGPTNFNEIYNNYITFEDVDYGRALGSGDGMENCAHNRFYSNYLYNCGVRLQIGGHFTEFCFNIIDTVVNDRTPYFSDRAQGLMLSTYETTPCKNNRYFNNVIYNCDDVGIFVEAYGKGDAFKIEKNVIANNIVMNCGRDNGSEYRGLGMVIKAENIGGNTYRNNCIYNAGGKKETVFYRDKWFLSVEAFNAMDGKNADTIVSNIAQDPLFVDPKKRQFALVSNSPCKGAGAPFDLLEAKHLVRVLEPSKADIGAMDNDVGSLGSGTVSVPLFQKEMEADRVK